MIWRDLSVPGVMVVRSDPDIERGANDVQLRLTYQGVLLGSNSNSTRVNHKHELRKCFHRQLKRFWEVHPSISKVTLEDAKNPSTHYMIIPCLSTRYERNGYNFVPLVSGFFGLDCSVHILILRQDAPGGLIKSSDLDNRLKTIFDAMRMPKDGSELGKYIVPGDDEKPFYCLLEDDSLVTQVTLETDTLLETVSDPPDGNDVRLIVRVELKPYVLGPTTAVFA